jgi:hypothetical protein
MLTRAPQPAAAAAAALLLLLLAAASPAAARVSEFTPSIVMTNMGEMGQPCLQMVDNAARLNANSVKFVPTVHYWGNAEHIGKYCYRCGGGLERNPGAANLRRGRPRAGGGGLERARTERPRGLPGGGRACRPGGPIRAPPAARCAATTQGGGLELPRPLP